MQTLKIVAVPILTRVAMAASFALLVGVILGLI